MVSTVLWYRGLR